MPTGRRLRGVPLTILLASVIGGLVAVAVALVLAVQWTISRSTGEALLQTRATVLLDDISRAIDGLLHPVDDQLAFLARRLESGEYRFEEPERLATLLTGALAAVPDADHVVAIAADGRFVRVEQTTDRGVRVITGTAGGQPRLEGALAELAKRREAFWGELGFHDGKPQVNLRRSLHRGDQFLGALAATVSAQNLSLVLGDFGEAHGVTPFVLYGRDSVLAHPNLASRHPQQSIAAPTVQLGAAGDLVLTRLWDAKPLPALSRAGNGIELRRIEIGDVVNFALVRRIDRYGDVPWFIGAWGAFESEIAAYQRVQWAGFVGLGVLALGVLLAIILARHLARPIRRTAAESAKVARLDLAQAQTVPPSFVRELDEQARAFNAMLAGLQAFGWYVPRRLVARLIEHRDPAGLQPEERELTIMFVDIVGFTGLSEHMAPSEVANLLNAHFTRLVACVEAEDGTVDKYIGDGLMAFSGAPPGPPVGSRANFRLRTPNAAPRIWRRSGCASASIPVPPWSGIPEPPAGLITRSLATA